VNVHGLLIDLRFVPLIVADLACRQAGILLKGGLSFCCSKIATRGSTFLGLQKQA